MSGSFPDYVSPRRHQSQSKASYHLGLLSVLFPLCTFWESLLVQMVHDTCFIGSYQGDAKSNSKRRWDYLPVWANLEDTVSSEISHTDKTNPVWCHLYEARVVTFMERERAEHGTQRPAFPGKRCSGLEGESWCGRLSLGPGLPSPYRRP